MYDEICYMAWHPANPLLNAPAYLIYRHHGRPVEPSSKVYLKAFATTITPVLSPASPPPNLSPCAALLWSWTHTALRQDVDNRLVFHGMIGRVALECCCAPTIGQILTVTVPSGSSGATGPHLGRAMQAIWGVLRDRGLVRPNIRFVLAKTVAEKRKGKAKGKKGKKGKSKKGGPGERVALGLVKLSVEDEREWSMGKKKRKIGFEGG